MTLAAAAQQPKATPPAASPSPAAIPTFKSTSRLVLLDVVVTDLNGQPVSGLTKSDFTVLEDKQPQSIVSFESTTAHPRNSISGSQAPVNIFVLDELNTAFADMVYSRDQLARYLRRQPEQLNQPAALVVINNTEFRVLQNYTRDRELLLADLKKHTPKYPWKLQKGWGVDRMEHSLVALQQIAAATMGIPGRKNVVWVGAGFPAINLIGVHQYIKDEIDGEVNLTINRLLEARVSLYPIDPTIMTSMRKVAATDSGDPGLGLFANLDTDPFDSDVNLANLGPATGGRSYHWRNDIADVIQTSVDDGASYYTIAYVPSNRSDDAKYRKIRIKMRPGLTARTRDGYYSTDTPMTKDVVAVDIEQAVENRLLYSGLPVSLTGRANQNTVSCTLYVNAQAISWQTLPNGDSRAQLKVAMAGFNANNKRLSYEVGEKISTTPAADFKALLKRPVALHVQVPVSADVKRLRFVVRDDATGHMGAIDVDPNHIPAIATPPQLYSEQ